MKEIQETDILSQSIICTYHLEIKYNVPAAMPPPTATTGAAAATLITTYATKATVFPVESLLSGILCQDVNSAKNKDSGTPATAFK